MPRRLYRTKHRYKVVEEVLTTGFDYYLDVGETRATDDVGDDVREIAQAHTNAWDNAVAWCQHRYYGAEVSTESLGTRGPARYWVSRNNLYGIATALSDLITLVVRASGVRSDGKPVRSTCQLSMVPANQIFCNGLFEDFYDDTLVELESYFPFQISAGAAGTITRCVLSKPAGGAPEIVALPKLTLNGLFGSRIDRILDRDNRGSKPPAVNP